MSDQKEESNQSAAEAVTSEPFRRFAWPVLSGVICVILGLAALKCYEDSMRGHERGRLVSSIVDQQFRQLSSGFSAAELQPADSSMPVSPLMSMRDDSTDLRRWLVQESFLPNETPSDLARKIQLILRARGHDRELSPVMRESLSRWISSLMSWSQEMNRHATGAMLLEEARQRYFEAAGYQKIGRSYDATVLHIWTISLLTRFVDRNPFGPHIPEALFMLGVAYLNLGHALPPQMRGDRILNLCGELYPDSLWARRSDTVWREVFIDEI